MLTLPLIAAVVAALVAVFAVSRARRVGARAEQLAESYWELRYEIGQLKTRVNRLESAANFREPEPDPEVEGPSVPPKTSFVPLSSLKK